MIITTPSIAKSLIWEHNRKKVNSLILKVPEGYDGVVVLMKILLIGLYDLFLPFFKKLKNPVCELGGS